MSGSRGEGERMWRGDIPSTSFPVNAKNNWLDQLRARSMLSLTGDDEMMMVGPTLFL